MDLIEEHGCDVQYKKYVVDGNGHSAFIAVNEPKETKTKIKKQTQSD